MSRLDHVRSSIQMGAAAAMKVRFASEEASDRELSRESSGESESAGSDQVQPTSERRRHMLELAGKFHPVKIGPIERAKGFRKAMDAYGWSATRLATELEISQPSISCSLALLNLPETIQARVETGEVPVTTAYEISKLRGHPVEQERMAERAAKRELTGEQAKAEVKAYKRGDTSIDRNTTYTFNANGVILKVKAESYEEAIQTLLAIATCIDAEHFANLAHGAGADEAAA